MQREDTDTHGHLSDSLGTSVSQFPSKHTYCPIFQADRAENGDQPRKKKVRIFTVIVSYWSQIPELNQIDRVSRQTLEYQQISCCCPKNWYNIASWYLSFTPLPFCVSDHRSSCLTGDMYWTNTCYMSVPREEIKRVCIYWLIDFISQPPRWESGESAAHRQTGSWSINVQQEICLIWTAVCEDYTYLTWQK